MKYIYTAKVWMPQNKRTLQGIETIYTWHEFKVVCNDTDDPPMYDGDNGTLNIKSGNQWKTFGNMPYQWTREALHLITDQEFKNGDLFAYYHKDLPRLIFSYSTENGEGFLLVHEDRAKFEVSHRLSIAVIHPMDYIQLGDWLHVEKESTVRLNFSNMYKLNV